MLKAISDIKTSMGTMSDEISKMGNSFQEKINKVIEETEKDRFVVTTTTETAHSKKVISGNLSGHAHDKCGASFHLRNHEEHPEASQRFLWPH